MGNNLNTNYGSGEYRRPPPPPPPVQVPIEYTCENQSSDPVLSEILDQVVDLHPLSDQSISGKLDHHLFILFHLFVKTQSYNFFFFFQVWLRNDSNKNNTFKKKRDFCGFCSFFMLLGTFWSILMISGMKLNNFFYHNLINFQIKQRSKYTRQLRLRVIP